MPVQAPWPEGPVSPPILPQKSDHENFFAYSWYTDWDGATYPFEQQHKFHPERKWTLDFAWPAQKVALEINGGTRLKVGSHSFGAGLDGDYEKYNAAQALGWQLFVLSDKMLYTHQHDGSGYMDRFLLDLKATLAARTPTDLAAPEDDAERPLTIGNFRIYLRRLEVAGRPTLADFAEAGEAIAFIEEAGPWAQGDWWNAAVRVLGENAALNLLPESAGSASRIRNYAAVCRKFPAETRQFALGYYDSIRTLPTATQQQLLQLAAANDWTQSQMRKAAQETRQNGGKVVNIDDPLARAAAVAEQWQGLLDDLWSLSETDLPMLAQYAKPCQTIFQNFQHWLAMQEKVQAA